VSSRNESDINLLDGLAPFPVRSLFPVTANCGWSSANAVEISVHFSQRAASQASCSNCNKANTMSDWAIVKNFASGHAPAFLRHGDNVQGTKVYHSLRQK
jgi:hypothetical protein